ncbi:hypothetical protein SESBI_50043 [Sesbania bispinosa]|nr:hypothetical protein SESBI_50043 [Sesbania bispinosa]
MDLCLGKLKSLENNVVVQTGPEAENVSQPTSIENQDSNGILDKPDPPTPNLNLNHNGDDQAIFGPWVLVKKKTPRKNSKFNSKSSGASVEKSQESQGHITGNSGTRFDILANEITQDGEPEKKDSTYSKVQKSNPVEKKIPIPKPVKIRSLNQKSNSGNSKKTTGSSKTMKKFEVPKESKPSVNPDMKELSPRALKEKEKKEDWEKEILAMMSRYHSKRWESYSKGEFVGDPYSLDRNSYYEAMQGLEASSSHCNKVMVDLDRPPDLQKGLDKPR